MVPNAPTNTTTSTEEIPEKPGILYIDSEEDNLVVFKSSFRRYFKVFTAMSGEEGLRILNSESISLVITDQRMPKMTGVQFLKSLPEDRDLIRIILTSHSDTASILDAINSGKIYRYILKPWEKESLKNIMETAVEELKQRQANRHLVEELRTEKERLEQKIAELTQKVNLQKTQSATLSRSDKDPQDM
ncbi:response regulator [Rufibacter latericius]|uniref:Response regulator n=1 Tax=Rufibacter latericius TaxID=2487040 RepID=A0A3M9MG70_9BACT|nr:response regulator [Rufibacter latericius]RNI24541.1 response regulator [Rufibacter latericius]